tara:strand:+ start:113 stop:439 length:327 start_codon:yes stop_codon:yes gene_type:complete
MDNKKGLCVQLTIYIILSIISIIFILVRPPYTLIGKIITVSIQLAINVGVGFLIYWLCSKCYKTAAWIVLFFPLIFSIIFSLIIFLGISIGAGVILNKHKKHNKHNKH